MKLRWVFPTTCPRDKETTFFRENINVQKPKREVRLNVPSLAKLGCGTEEQNESFLTFILLFAHLALTLFPNK